MDPITQLFIESLTEEIHDELFYNDSYGDIIDIAMDDSVDYLAIPDDDECGEATYESEHFVDNFLTQFNDRFGELNLNYKGGL